MAEIKEEFSTTHPNGKKIYVYTLLNKAGTVVRITNYGAIIMAIKLLKADQTYNDIVLGFDNPADYWSEEYLRNYPYYGAAIGRYANRIKGNKINIDGNTIHLNTTADYMLHGGQDGFDKKVWDRIAMDNNALTLQYISPDGEEGFPGNLTVQITFSLTDDNSLSYEYTASTDKATAVNLTHHSYFNLNNGTGTIHKQHIKINAANYLEQDTNYCTTGTLLPVKETRNDFRFYNQTGNIADPEKGIDISFVIDNPGIENIAAEAYCDEQDVKLQIYTTEPIVHLYNSYGSPAIQGKNGQHYKPFSGFCLETQIHPNAINLPQFPNTVLKPGEQYYSHTIYKLVNKNK